MTEHPDQLIAPFADAGADYITFHVEACVHAHRVIQSIKALGKKPGISLVPSTPLSFIEELLPLVDLILVMTVNPGFGGQALLPECLAKAGRLVRLREKLGLNFLVSIDGGINSGTVVAVRKEHPDVLVTGSAFFAAKDKQLFIRDMKGLC
jgi:ribulose-phosphate 3-epimerase